jgi:hypothetical protein
LGQFSAVHLRGNESKFEPKEVLEGKSNYGVHVFVDRDGSISEIVRLNILNDRDREEIIGFHYAQQHAKIHYSNQLEKPHFYVVGRDNPWDFEYLMHDGSTFFLEVCRVADEDLLKAIKIENDVTLLLTKPTLYGFEIQKIERHFPGTVPMEIVNQVVTKADTKRKFDWDNSSGPPKLFIRPTMSPQLDLRKELEKALLKKASKNHAGKERTVIILDNLTTHSGPRDFFDALDQMGEFLENLPFKSVWFYTGYYSGDDGYNCEFSLIPMKLPHDELKSLTEQSKV